MHLTLYLPNILSMRGEAGAVPGMRCRALETLLARAEQQSPPSQLAHEQILFSLFDLTQEENADLPVAAVCRLHDAGETDNDWWIRADPVHLNLEREGLSLVDANSLAITPDEAQRLSAEVMNVFAEDGWLLTVPQPDRWYLKPARAPKMTTALLSQVTGRDIHDFLPQGPDGKSWHTTLNEVQILLHTAAANTEREKNGKLPINSLWFWGGGCLPRLKPVRWTRIGSREPVVRSLANLAGVPVENVPEKFDEWRAQADQPGEYLVVLDDTYYMSLYGDAQGWSRAMQQLEQNWMMPLWQALKSNDIASATLITDGGMRFSLTPRLAHRWWRRRKPLAAYQDVPGAHVA